MPASSKLQDAEGRIQKSPRLAERKSPVHQSRSRPGITGISTGAGIAWSGFPALACKSSAKVGHKRRTNWQANATKKSKEVFNQWRYDHFFPNMQAKRSFILIISAPPKSLDTIFVSFA